MRYQGFLRLFTLLDAVKLVFHKLERVKESVEENNYRYNPSQCNSKRPKAFLIPIVYKPIELPCSLIQEKSTAASRSLLIFVILAPATTLTLLQLLLIILPGSIAS